MLGVAFVALLTLIFFAPLLSGKTLSNVPSTQQISAPWQPVATKPTFVFPQVDQALYAHPYTVLQTDAWRAGTVPLWNPYNLGGLPLLANGSAGVLYPLRIVLAVLVTPSVNHDLFVLLHVFATGVFMFLLMKEFRLRLLPALLGAAGWMFASWNTGWMQIEVMLPVTTWLPAALLLIHRGFRTRSWRTAAAAGVPLGLMALGGQLSMVAIAVAICGAYSAALAVAPSLARGITKRFDPRRLVHPVLTLGVGGGLAAVTLVTTLWNASQGGRVVVPFAAFFETHTISGGEFAHVFSGGDRTLSTLFFSGVFVGLAPLLLAFVGFVRRHPGAALGRWLAVATLLFAVGTPALTRIVYVLVPGASRLSSTGYVLWAFDFGVLILAAIGLDGVLEWSGRLAQRLGRGESDPARSPVSETTVQRARRRRLRAAIRGLAPLTAVIAVGATSWQLIDYARYINPPFSERRASALFPVTPAIAAVQDDREHRNAANPQRLIGFNALFGNEALVFSFEDSGGYDDIAASRVRSFWLLMSGYSVSDALVSQELAARLGIASGSSGAFLTRFSVSTTRFDLLPRAGVTTVIASPSEAQLLARHPPKHAPVLTPIHVGRDASVLDIAGNQPRAWVVHQAEVVGRGTEALERFADPAFDYRNRMIVEPDQGLGTPGRVLRRGSGRGAVANRDPIALNGAGFTVETESPGWLVMADMYAPGWQVDVNGRSARLLRANYALRAVPVPAGKSRVVLSYHPPGLVLGVATSGITVVGLLVVAVFALRARRRRAHAPTCPDGEERGPDGWLSGVQRAVQ